MKERTIRIDVRELDQADLNFGNGFERTISGNRIAYHSSHPEARTALIARANAGENEFSWVTGKDFPIVNDNAQFVWVGGLATCQEGSHRFGLYLKGKKLLDIHTGDGVHDIPDLVHDESGCELRFDKQFTDMFGDLFGWFYLSIPFSLISLNEALTLEIRGEEANSQDWIMVFEYSLDGLPKYRMDPILASRDGKEQQFLDVNLDFFGQTGCVSILTSDLEQTHSLHYGLNSLQVELPAVQEKTMYSVEYHRDGIFQDKQEIALQPVIPRKVFILPYSHNDIGYTDIQTNVIEKQCRNLDTALEQAEMTEDFPADASAKWNLEVIWALEHWWNRTDDIAHQRFIHFVKNGQIGLNALYANLLSGLCNTPELNHHFDLAHRITGLTGYPITTATVTDIPGFVWGLQTALFENGVKYFSIAPNAGDRTGHIYKGLGDKPFYWVSPCGTKKVLTWVKGASYSQFHRERITTTGIRKLMDYLKSLDQKQYPYHIVALPYTIGGDNGGPDEDLPAFVRAWNENYASPHLVISTHEQLFHEFESAYGETLPELKGDMTPYWEDGAVSTAYETTLVRRASDRLLQTEVMHSLYAPASYSRDAFYHAWQQVILWDEHTWGAWNSVLEPDSPFVQEQWRIKREFALECDRLSRILLQDLLKSENSDQHELTFFNTSGFPVRKIIQLPEGHIPENENVPMQVNMDGTCECLLDFTNGWMSKTIKVQNKSANLMRQNISTICMESCILENDAIRIVVDQQTGTVNSLYHKIHDIEYVKMGDRFLELTYLTGKYPQIPSLMTDIEVLPLETGQLFDRLTIHGSIKGCRSVEMKLRLYHHSTRVDVELVLDKIAVREKESVHIAFPIGIGNGVLKYDCAGKAIQPEIDQLPGACRNFYSPTGYVDVSNDSYGMTVALLDSPLIEIGRITAEMPWLEHIEPSNSFYSYILNNYWHTNYKAEQSGILVVRYAILLHEKFDEYDAMCFARSEREPVLLGEASYVKAFSLVPPPKPFVVLSMQPLEKGVLLLVLNASATKVEWVFEKQVEVHMSTPSGVRDKLTIESLILQPYEQEYLVIEEKAQ